MVFGVNQELSFKPNNSAPRLERGQPVFDHATWLRLPRPGDRCPVSGLSRSTLVELVRPCDRNDFQPPVEARHLKRRGNNRGVLLISRESLLRFLDGLPSPAQSAKTEAAQ